jgi:hypothetical protein
LIALFAALQCWSEGVEGLVFTHDDLVPILGFKRRIEESHIKQLSKNMGEFLPFCVPMWASRPKKLIAYFVSRRSIVTLRAGQHISIEKQIEKQIKELNHKGIPIKQFSIWEDRTI